MDITKAKEDLIAANAAYRVGSPTMSDQEFDALLEQLQANISAEEYDSFRDALNDVSAESSSAKKVTHRWIAGSLDKLKYEEPDKVCKYLAKHTTGKVNVSAKIDGISGIAKYVGGSLVSFATRGDGMVGSDITDKAPYIQGLKQKINAEEETYIRGELVVKKDIQKQRNMKAARNVVAGLINRGDWDPKDIQDVSFVAYTVLGDKYTKDEQFAFLEENGFETAWHIFYDIDSYRYSVEKGKKNKKLVPAVKEDVVDELFSFATQDFPYDTDGLVISDGSYRNEDTYRPDAQVAFKTNLQRFDTKLLEVEFQGPSKDGYYVPVGILDPIEIGGVMVGKCTLHNLDFMAKKGVKLGSIVSICRSGDVIPKLLGVVESSAQCIDVPVPEFCACCGTKLERDGVNLRCKNKCCKDQKLLQIEHFIKRLDVKNCSVATLERFGIFSYDDLIAFKPDSKHKSEVGLYDELDSKVFTSQKKDIFASLNFHGIAETTVGKIVDHFGLDKILEQVETGTDMPAWFDESIKVLGLPNGVGDSALSRFLDDLGDAVADLNKFIHSPRYKPAECTGDMSGAKPTLKGSVCFTGSLSVPRSEAEHLAEAAGYEVKSGVNKKLTYLVTDDTESGSSKNRKAKELGIKVLTGAEFMKLVNAEGAVESIDSL